MRISADCQAATETDCITELVSQAINAMLTTRQTTQRWTAERM